MAAALPMMQEAAQQAEAQKRTLRRFYQKKRAELPAPLRAARDDAVCAALLQQPCLADAAQVFFYAPIGFEIDIMPVFASLAAQGRITAFPRCKTEDCTMAFYAVNNAAALRSGAYGIREPAADAPLCLPTQDTVLLTPGLLFDTAGYRIGYGKGYYDRYLASFPGRSLGIIYEDFIVSRVPRGCFDRCVDGLVCEKGVRTTHAIG